VFSAAEVKEAAREAATLSHEALTFVCRRNYISDGFPF
jgi:hypothetical protein